MGLLLVTFAGLAAVIIVSAMFLAKYADRIASQTGLGGSVTGLVLLAGATSLPELSIGFSAVRMGAVDLTAGDVLGSSLINLAILAVLDLMSRTPGRILSRQAAQHALSAIVACLLTAYVLLGMLLKSPFSFLRAGPMSWVLLVTYAICARLVFRDQRMVTGAGTASVQEAASRPSPASGDQTVEDQIVQDQATGDQMAADGPAVSGIAGGAYEIITPTLLPAGPAGGLWLNVAGFVVAAAVIFFAAPPLAHTADVLAAETGLGRTFFGTVFVATMTSLPEAVATLAALRLGTVDLAIGNILGSNAFNMVILGVVDLGSAGPILAQVSDVHRVTACCVLMTTCVTMLSLLYRAEKRWWLIEPDAALILLMVVGSLWLVYLQGVSG